GGMGVGVMSSVLARAGTREGYHVRFNDKKGLAIRNGAVSAHVLYSNGKAKISTIVPNGKADLLMGVDMLEAERSLVYASRAHTTAVVTTTVVPTIPMLPGMMNYPPDADEHIRRHTNSEEYCGSSRRRISILTLFGAKETSQSVLDMKAKQLSHSYWMFWRGKKVADEYRRLVESTVATMRLDEDTNRAIARRVYDLIMWGELPYAEKYVDKV